MNFDAYARGHTSVAPLVQQAAPAAGPPAEAGSRAGGAAPNPPEAQGPGEPTQ